MPRIKSDNICLFEKLINNGWEHTARTEKRSGGATGFELEKRGQKIVFPVDQNEKLKAMELLAEKQRNRITLS